MPPNLDINSVQIGTAIAVIVIVFVVCTYIAYSLRRMFRRWAFGDARAKIAQAWQDVEKLMARGDEMSMRLAVMHADSVLDKALQAKHFPGDRFATRLQFASRKYRTLRKVWWAHKLRNTLAHEPHAKVHSGEARRAVAAFKNALQALGAIS